MKKLTCTCGATVDVTRFGPGSMLRCGRCKRIVKVPKEEAPQTKSRPVPGSRPAMGTTRTNTPRLGMPAIKARPKPSGPNKALVFGGAGALVAVIGIVIALSHNGPPPTNSSHEEERAKKGYEQILATHNPHDGRGWFAVAQDCQTNGFKKEYEESIEKAVAAAPEDPEIGAAYRKLAESWLVALDRSSPDFVKSYYEVAERVEKAGLKSYALDLYEDIAGDHLPERTSKKQGFDPANPLANKKLGRVLTPMGTWEDKELYEEMQAKLADMTARDAYIKSLPPLQRQALEQKSALEKQRGLKFNTLADPPYLIAVQEGNYDKDIILQDFRDVMDRLYKVFKGEYAQKFGIQKAFEGDDANLLRIIIYDSSDTYFQQNPDMPEWAGGHFDTETGDIQVFRGTPDPYETLFHEGTHQLVAAATRVLGAKHPNTHWMTEGIACYFESFDRDPKTNEFRLGKLSNTYGPQIRMAVRNGTPIPFDQLRKAKGKAFWSPFDEFLDRDYPTFMKQQYEIRDGFTRRWFVDEAYAEAWSLVYFLRNYDNGKYRDKFDEYLKSELGGKGGIEVFKKTFGDVKQIEKEWTEYIRDLKPSGN